jgi:hypothetical protein
MYIYVLTEGQLDMCRAAADVAYEVRSRLQDLAATLCSQ